MRSPPGASAGCSGATMDDRSSIRRRRLTPQSLSRREARRFVLPPKSPQEILYEARNERRAFRERGDLHVLAVGVRQVADGAEAVEHRYAERGEEVPVRSAAHRGLGERTELSGQRLRPREERG